MFIRGQKSSYKYRRTPSGTPILAFAKKKTINATYIQIDILSDILKIGGTTDKNLVELSKEIWKYLLLKQFTLTVEYVSDILNTRAYWKSRDSKNLQEWKLSPIVFQHIYRKIESQ